MAGLRPVLLSRVVLGRILETEDTDTSTEVEAVMRSRYDSVLANREAAVGTFKEYIVFDDDQCYPEYVIWYRRKLKLAKLW